MIFTTFRIAVIIKPKILQRAQIPYQMDDVDSSNILIELIVEIAFEKVEKSDFEKTIYVNILL